MGQGKRLEGERGPVHQCKILWGINKWVKHGEEKKEQVIKKRQWRSKVNG